MKLEFSRVSLEKYPSIKFHENPPGWSRIIVCGRTDRQIYVRRLVVAFRTILRKAMKNTQVSNFTKIRPVGAELLYVDGRTGRYT
jgi:hypothetical protein